MDPLDAYPAMMTAAQVCEYTGISVERLSKWRQNGRGPVWVKMGEGPTGAVRYPREALRKYVEDNTVRPAVAS
jgi:hypothetical protein